MVFSSCGRCSLWSSFYHLKTLHVVFVLFCFLNFLSFTLFVTLLSLVILDMYCLWVMYLDESQRVTNSLSFQVTIRLSWEIKFLKTRGSFALLMQHKKDFRMSNVQYIKSEEKRVKWFFFWNDTRHNLPVADGVLYYDLMFLF